MDSKEEKVVVNEEVNINEEKTEVTDEKDIKIQTLEKKIENLNNEIESIKRAAADIVNRSKQYEMDKKYASADVVRKLLIPMSYFEGALKYPTEDDGIKKFLKGFDMIYTLILNQLYTEGLKEIETNLNDNFNPFLHEVSEVVETEDTENDKIVEIIQKGYYFKDRVIQPVRVKISKKKEKAETKDKKDEKVIN